MHSLFSTIFTVVGEDYASILTILSIPVGSGVGTIACTSIPIIDNNKTEDVEYFSVHSEVVDLNVKVSQEEAIINIIDDGKIIDVSLTCRDN